MKKLSVILLLFVLACGLLMTSACGEKEEEKKDEAATEAGGEGGEEEATPAPTPAPTPEPTEPPPTTEKPPIITQDIAVWTFAEDNPVFRAGNHIENLRVEGNILKLTSIGGDPFMYSINNDLQMDAGEVDYIKVKVKNGSSAFGCQVFFITYEDGGWSEAMSIRGDYWNSDGEDWEEFTFYTDECDLWEGKIKELRFDPMVAEGDFEMEYMAFQKIVG
ncbi:MAG: hypothetical protein FWG34_03345 [Oscillospiraceae bacterium]|nr:hypothetical protein [Oscillospiraceae bacterium]